LPKIIATKQNDHQKTAAEFFKNIILGLYKYFSGLLLPVSTVKFFKGTVSPV
jgi:hypothetical protein